MSKRDNKLEWYDAFDQVASSQKKITYVLLLLIMKILSKEPRIKVSTIHGAKGGEATNVVLFLNQTTKHYESC